MARQDRPGVSAVDSVMYHLRDRRRRRIGACGLRFCFFAADLIKIIGPPLHHLPAFRQVLRMIVSSPDGVPFAVGKLAFNHVRTKAMLVQDGAGGAAKSMPGGA